MVKCAQKGKISWSGNQKCWTATKTRHDDLQERYEEYLQGKKVSRVFCVG